LECSLLHALSADTVDLNNDKLVNESYYDAVNNVYQISKYVKYDNNGKKI
jgi:hypothetical protein